MQQKKRCEDLFSLKIRLSIFHQECGMKSKVEDMNQQKEETKHETKLDT
jgi:hypothetical protein